MQVLFFEEKGEAGKVLKFGEKNIPTLRKNEIQIKVKASPINPADFMFIEKQYRIEPEFPQIAGFEGAGIIVENGGDETFPINSTVAFRSNGAWADYINIEKDKIVLLPENMPIEKASQLSLNTLTAWALLQESNVKKNDWVILSAGNSSVSKLIIQFAKNKGIKTIPIIRNLEQKEELINLGANLVIKSDNKDIEQQIRELVKTANISGFLDAVGGDLASTIIKVISPNSKIIHYGLFSDQNIHYHNSDIIFKNLTVKGFGIDGWINHKIKVELDNIWIDIIKEVIKKDFRMDIASKYSLKEFKEAIVESKNSKDGKVLFWMD